MSPTLSEMKLAFERDSMPPDIPKVEPRFYDETPVDEDIKEDDAINPKHYKSAGGIEAIQAMEAFSTLDEFRGHLKLTALKYISRLGLKDDESQEIGKAMWYLEKLKTTYAEDYTHGGR